MNKKIFVILAVSFLWIGLSDNALATNGFKLIGVGAINRGMGGAGVAAPQDSSAIVLNPAGLTAVDDQLNMSLDFHNPTIKMDSSNAPAGNAGANNLESNRPVSIIPAFGLTHKLKDTPFSFGIGMFPVAGCGVDFDRSRLTSIITSNLFDKFTDYQFMVLASGLAYEVNERLSLGITANLDFSTFRTDTATGANVETSGAKKTDYVFGGGFTLGGIYKLTDMLSFGMSYTSRQWMQKFERYQDSVPRLDQPQQVVAGFGYTPTDKWLLLMDAKWIDWDSVSVLGEMPAGGAFGWRDQYVYSMGAQYKVTKRLTLRGGYNYGKSPIGPDRVFANLLFPAISEHHVSLGAGWLISKSLSIDFTYEHAFKHTMTDNGLGDSYSVNGRGSEASSYTNAFIVQMNVKF